MDLNEPTLTYLESDLKPSLRLPKDACDTHVHVFGPASHFPYGPFRNFTPVDAPKEKLYELHRRLGISRCVIVQSAVHGTDNRAVEDAIAHGDGNYLGIALVDPAVSAAELMRLKNAGFRGVRFNFIKHIQMSISPSDLIQFCSRLADLDLHLQVHFERQLIHELTPTLKACAQVVPVVIDHMGRIDANDGLNSKNYLALSALLDEPNFHVKVSGIDRIDPTPPYFAGKRIAADLMARYPSQCLWGLDWPHPNHTHIPDDAMLVDELKDITPSPAELERLLVTNPQNLYKFQE